MSNLPDIEQYLFQGEQRLWEAAQNEYGDNTGKLRGGSAGCVTKSGDILGHCHRLSLLDYLGVRTFVPDPPKLRMFAAGFWNEDYIAEALGASDFTKDGYILLREEECQLTWDVINPATGETVQASGRPDALAIRPRENYTPPMHLSSGEVIAATNYEPVLGLELKKISSQWRTNEVYAKDDPSNDYLIQAANYSYRLGRIPWRILFSNYDNHSTYKRLKVEPGRKYFRLSWDEDRVLLDGKPTTITGAGIDAYYGLLLEMKAVQDLGPRPSSDSAVAGGSKQWEHCKGCVLAETCDRYEDNFTDWLGSARHTLGEEK